MKLIPSLLLETLKKHRFMENIHYKAGGGRGREVLHLPEKKRRLLVHFPHSTTPLLWVKDFKVAKMSWFIVWCISTKPKQIKYHLKIQKKFKRQIHYVVAIETAWMYHDEAVEPEYEVEYCLLLLLSLINDGIKSYHKFNWSPTVFRHSFGQAKHIPVL